MSSNCLKKKMQHEFKPGGGGGDNLYGGLILGAIKY